MAQELRRNSLEVRAALSFVFADAAWAKEDAEAVLEDGAPIPSWSIPLFGALTDIDVAERLARGVRTKPMSSFRWDGPAHDRAELVDRFLPTLLASCGVGAIHAIAAVRAHADWAISKGTVECIDSPEAIEWLVRYGYKEERFFADRLAWAAPALLGALKKVPKETDATYHLLAAALRSPEIAETLEGVNSPPAQAALLALRAHLVPEATELPAWFHKVEKKAAKLPKGVVPLTLPRPRIANRALPAVALTKLVSALGALKGPPAGELQSVLTAFDADSLDALTAAIVDEALPKWSLPWITHLGGSRTVAALAKRVLPLLLTLTGGREQIERMAKTAGTHRVRDAAKAALADRSALEPG
jgi:hypothetical protein